MHINIVSFNIPLPANYGGVIDIFYKIKAFHKAGVKVHLHCFEYNRPKSKDLNLYCESVNYYKRNLSFLKLFSFKPYIISTRSSEFLTNELTKNDYPILYEGLHTTANIDSPKLKNRIKIIRTHNIEHHYYMHLFKSEKNFRKKLFFLTESIKLKLYEKKLFKNCDLIAAISPSDYYYFNTKYNKTIYLPCFHPNEKIKINQQNGNYTIYHGNLSVNENIDAVIFLIENVFNKLNIDFHIAGSNPDKKILASAKNHNNIKLFVNPSEETMNELISNAQVQVLPTFQATGIKLKLLQSLFIGKHCIVNKNMVENTNLENLCIIAETPEDFLEKIKKYFKIDFTDKMLNDRYFTLEKYYSNSKNINNFCDNIKKLLEKTKDE